MTDTTDTLSASEQQLLIQQLQDITYKTRAQVAVLVIPSIRDDSIEQYATRVSDNWCLGNVRRNDEILIIVAWSGRTVRIQIGYGLEEGVTNTLADNIIRNIMILASKKQKLARGLESAIIALNNQLISQYQYPSNLSENESASSSNHYYFAIFWVSAVMLFLS